MTASIRSLVAVLALVVALVCSASALGRTYQAGTSTLIFDGNAAYGFTPWNNTGGGPQCSPPGGTMNPLAYPPRYRGPCYSGVSIGGLPAIDLFSPYLPSLGVSMTTYYDEAEGATNGAHYLTLSSGWPIPADEYWGLAFYVPVGFKVSSNTGFVNMGEFHMSNVGGQPPMALFLFSDHVRVQIAAGAWSSSTGFPVGCRYISSLCSLYAVPPGGLVPGAWNEIAWHVRWAADNTGQEQFYYRAQGGSWTPSGSFSGHPTIAWNAPSSFVSRYANDIWNYGHSTTNTAGFHVYFNREVQGTTLASVESVLP